MPRVSIIIPTFNSARYIKRSIESILAQSYRDFEILVVDDGSTDSTVKEIEPFLVDRAVRLFQQNNGGPSAARNRGIKESKGDLVMFLDSDDFYLADRIEEGVKALNAKRNVDIAYSNEIFFLDESHERQIESPHPKFSGDIFFYLKRSNFIHTSTVTARRFIFDKWQFDNTLRNHEDWDLFLKAARDGVQFYYIPKSLVKINLRRQGLTYASAEWDKSRKIVGERARAYWKYLKKNDFARYVKLKTKAVLAGFPRNKRFNKSMPHDLLNTEQK